MRILKLPRSTPVGSLLYRLKASAAQENPLKFMIANGTDVNLITIKSVDFYQANVYLNKSLQENEYNFTIYVTDGVERTLVDCQIVVKNGSQLMTSSFIHFRPLLSVPESASFNSTIGYIHVKERDNSNLPVTFEIEGSDCFGIRYIFGPKGTSKAEIYLKTQLDFEVKNLFRLQVYALNAWTNETFDTRNIVMKELIITVINEQDTPPIFKQMPHLVQLTEANSLGDIILTLNAVDGDQEQDRKIKYYLRQDDELYRHFFVDENSGEVVINGTIDSLRELVGNENLFTLTFVAREVDDESSDGRLTGRKIDNHNYEFDHLVSGLNADLDSQPDEADTYNSFIVNNNFYDDESQDNNNLPHLNSPASSSLTSDLFAVDSSKIDNQLIDSRANKERDYKSVNTKFDAIRVDRENNLMDNSEIIDQLVPNRIPLKSTPINIPPLMPSQFKKRMLINQNFSNHQKSYSNLHPEVINLLKPPINLTNELNIIESLASATRATTSTAKPFYVTSKPMAIKSTTTFRPQSSKPITVKSTTQTSTPLTIRSHSNHQSIKSTHSTSTSPSINEIKNQIKYEKYQQNNEKKINSSTLPSILSRPIYSNGLLIKNQIHQSNKSSRNQERNFNLANDNLVADEHFIVNNLTSIGLMDANFRPENLIEPENSAENSRFNNERANAMNAVLNELSGLSRIETEVGVGFIILQISNHAPEFPSIKPNFTMNNDPLLILYGEIEENSRPYSLVQFEKELLITDQDHGLNGTFDVQLIDQTKIFDIQPKFGYRNQTFQIQVINSNQLRMMENQQINLKIIVTDRSPFKPLKSELVLSIRVLNTNDNFPQFISDVFTASINEKEEIGKIIIRISATDSDSEDYGHITYSHLLGDLSNNLELDKITGDIRLVSLENIDREKQDFYTLIIYVCDNFCKAGESNSNQTLLFIKILDFNDNRPEWSVPRYDYMLNSDLFTFSSPIQVNATDADQPNTINSNVTYEIISGNLQNKFKINELTGEIQLISPLLMEGSETLPIIDLENDQPNASLDDDETRIDKNRMIDYPWTEDNFDLVHLDNLFSYFSPVINLTIRAHDQGIPILDNFINVYIHSQNYINRSVVFLVNDSEQAVKRKKQEYERYLSEMASGRVKIKTIQEPPSMTNPLNRTLVYSTITYPSQSVVNVNKVNWYSAKILGAPPNMLNVPGGWSWLNLTGINRQGRNQLDTNTHTVRTAGLDNNNFITWLLIMIILISLIFLLILIAIWCYFCGCRKRKNKINSADSNNYYSHHLKTQQMNRQLLKHQQLENDSIDSQQADLVSGGGQKTDIKQQQLSAASSQRANYQMSEFDASAFNGGSRFKKRIKPGSAVFDNTGYVSDADPLGNFILTARKPRSAPDNGQRSTYVDDTGVFTSNRVNYDRTIDAQHGSPLDIYNNEDAYSILNRVWFGKRGEEKQKSNQEINQQTADQKEDPNDLYSTVKRNKVKFTDEGDSSCSEDTRIDRRMSQDETSVKQLQDKHRTASQLTLRSQFDQIESSDSKEKPLLQVSLDPDDLISRPKAILKNADQQKRSSLNISPSSDTDSGIVHKDANKLKNDGERKESLKDKESIRKDSNQSKPPTPPPLPSSLTSQHLPQITQKLHLKNEEVAQKRSVFTIAYNAINADRLNSADSSTVYI